MAYTLLLWTLLLITDMTVVLYLNPSRALFILSALTLFAILQAVYQLVLYPAYFSHFKHLPTPVARTCLTGNENGFFRERKWDVAKRLYESVPNSGLIRYYTVLSHEILLLTTPAAYSEVMIQRVSDFDQTPTAKFQAERITGKGIQFMNGDEHKTHRKYLMPIFTPGHVKTLTPVFWSKAVELVQELEKEVETISVVHITTWSLRVALDIIGLAGLNHNYDTLRNPDNEHQPLTKLYRLIMANAPPAKFRMIGLLLEYIPSKVLYLIPEGRNMVLGDSFGKLRNLASETVESRQGHAMVEKGKPEHKDIISVSLHSGVMSKDAIVDHVMTFHAAGHITTSVTLDWTMYELGRHPELQSRLRQEIRSHLPHAASDLHGINANDIESLPLLQAVCSETLRFYPALPYTTRTAVRDTSILGSKVPKGTTVAWCAYAVNRDKAFWGRDADVWNPGRWLGDGQRARTGGSTNNFALLTFAAGPKNCIGQHWARVELACLVAAMIGRFEIRLHNPDTAENVDPVTALMSKEGIYARIKVIPGW